MKMNAYSLRFVSKIAATFIAAWIALGSALSASAQTNYDYSNTTSGSIPDDSDCSDANVVLRTFNVTDSFTIDDLNVGVVIDHTWRGDLTVSLESPAGTRFAIVNQVGGGQDDLNVRLDDEAGTAIGSGTQDSGATYPDVTRRPSNALSTFDGEQANGTWTMRVCDSVAQDTGTFLQGHLEFTSTAGGGGGTAVTTYSEDFVGGTTYGNTPGSTQYANWESFRSNAPTSGIQSLTVSGSIDTTGRTCSVAATAQSLMDALRTGGAATASCDGNNWAVGTCGNSMEITVGSSSIVCQCNTTNYTVRPLITNANWGGVGTNTCGGSSQTLTVSYSTPSSADPLVVTSTADTNTIGTLRYAINHANANSSDDDITFDISGAGPHVITLASVLPAITDDGVSIDGTTQSGASCGDLWDGTPHSIQIEIDVNGGSFNAIEIQSDNVSIRGLAIHGVNWVVGNSVNSVLFQNSASSGSVTCSYMGLRADGTDAGATSAGFSGVFLNGADSITVGGNAASDGVVIANAENAAVRLESDSTDFTAEGNFIGTDPSGAVARPNALGITFASGTGTWNELRKNLISGNTGVGITTGSSATVTGASGDVVIAGNYIGTDRTGNAALPNTGNGISLESLTSGVTIGGTTAADRNLIGGGNRGITLDGSDSIEILGNYLGVGADGTSNLGSSSHAILLRDVDGVEVGDGTSSGRNVIGHSGSDGINIIGSSANVRIRRNYIGVGADGVTPAGTGRAGISVFGSPSTQIGGAAAGEGNIIANSGGDGIVAPYDFVTVAILGNSIYDNADLGIDLDGNTDLGNGVTANDSGDGDTGGNDLLNYPIINSVTADGSTSVDYDINLDVPTNTDGYRVEFFRNSAADSTGYGEGETYLGAAEVAHSGGDLNFTGSFTASVTVSPGDLISATATRLSSPTTYDITSEFAETEAAVNSPLVVTSVSDTNTIGTLRYAINHANANAGDDAITFDISGVGPHVITLGSALPDLTDDGISIDGTTQSGASCGDLWAGTPHTLLIELEAGGSFDVLRVDGDNISISGLSLTSGTDGIDVQDATTGTTVQCNYIGLNPDGTADGNSSNGVYQRGDNTTLGGTVAGEGNVISGNTGRGVYLFGNLDLSIQGNFIGTNPAGSAAIANGSDGIYAAGGTSSWGTIQNNLISGNGGRGLHANNNNTITPTGAEIGVIGNYFGVDRTGLSPIANTLSNIAVRGATVTDFVIGGTDAGDRNIFGGSGDYGVDLRWQSNVSVIGNYIGVGADGTTDVGNSSGGVYLADGSNLTIGDGTAAGGNVIANNGGPGITAINQFGTGSVPYLANSIYSNTGLGIDLNDNGATVNDSGDSDTGPNDLLNFPVINLVIADATTSVDYDFNLDAPSNTEGYRIEFFRNSAADSTGYGEGETFLGFIDTGNHAGGNLNFTGSFTAAENVSTGDIISTTATRKTGATSYDITSEFSLNYTAIAGLPDLQVVMSVDVYDPDTLNLYSLPENDVVTTLSVTNAGEGPVDAGSINLIIPVSNELTFYNGDFDDAGPETDAVIFNETSSGLSFNSATNLAFANGATKPADFASCTYSPALGYDPNVTFVCVNPSGSMQFGNPDPTFSVQFRSRIE